MWWVLLLVAIFSHQAIGQDDTLVNTKYGWVNGKIVTFNDGRTVRSFLGVPFAKPPNGTLRFMHPQEPDPWQETFEAQELGNACPQSSGNIAITHPFWDKYSEDCLNLNIYTPHNHEDPGPYPVMIYYYGGVFRTGSNIQYPGHFYAARGVIVVSANYRVSRIGFAGFGDPAMPGNQGMMDQVQAMRFVQENIANFGGNPDRVTIFGQSAGGASVGLHLVSPLTSGLFHQAILHSGTDLSIWSHNEQVMAANVTRQIAINLECPTEPVTAMADCMKALPAETVNRAEYEIYIGNFSLGFVPFIDGPGGYLPEAPLDLRKKGLFNKVPIIAGYTSNEAGPVFLPIEDGLNRTEFEIGLQGVSQFFFNLYDQEMIDDVAEAMIFEYTDWPYRYDAIKNRDNVNALGNHLAFETGTDHTIRWHAEYGAYQYSFGFRSDILDLALPEWTGVFHAADVPYIFGHPLVGEHDEVVDDTQMDAVAIIPWTDADLDFANYWIDMLSNFSKTGNPTPNPQPGPPGLPSIVWQPWTAANSNVISINKTAILQYSKVNQRKHALWREYVPWMTSRRSPDPDDAKYETGLWPIILDQMVPDGVSGLETILENVMGGIPSEAAGIDFTNM